MKEFLLVFRSDPANGSSQHSPEQMQSWMKEWQDWMGGMAAQNKLVSPGNRLAPEGAVLKPNQLITNGPYVEIKEAIGGYTIVQADSLEDAISLAKNCPIFKVGGNVEVRSIIPMEAN